MANKYLGQEWLDMVKDYAQEFPERPGATARMQYKVSGAPDGDVAYYQVIENGKMLESTVGEDANPDFTINISYDDSKKVQQGDLDANAAFMQGRMKVEGNMGKLMALMPLTQSAEYKAIQEKVNADTEY
jgi:putative sterol carrier protein